MSLVTQTKQLESHGSNAAASGGGGAGLTHHHLTPLPVYFAVYGSLLVLTVLTVAVSYAGFPQPWSIIIALVVASIKALLVASYFMHLKFDEPYNRVIFAGSLFFLFLFFYFTFADLKTRGLYNEEETIHIAPAIMEKIHAAHPAEGAEGAEAHGEAPAEGK